jgi:hypothetical protein
MANVARKRRPAAHDRFRFQYAAKFICTANIPGTSQTTSSFLPGTYQTAVNIHNPLERLVKLRMKIAMADGPISNWVARQLKDDAVTKVDCAQIQDPFDLHPIHGLEGFLVIESTDSVDVIAVYTAGRGDVASIDVEEIKERRLR